MLKGPDSSSTSSCNSSTPSSPALNNSTYTPQHPGKAHFLYPDVMNPNDRDVFLETHPISTPPLEKLDRRVIGSQDSDKTVSVSGSGSLSTDSERTPIRVDSQDSQVSDGEADRGKQNFVNVKIKTIWVYET